MRAIRLCVAAALLVATSVEARVSRPMGRSPKSSRRLGAPRVWQDKEGAFALERPDGERWSFQGGVRGPDGGTLPLLALSEDSGAQLIVQNADGLTNVKALASLLAEHLNEEQRVRVDVIERVLARGGEAYAFSFTVADEARGRVAVVRAGDHLALVIASWPLGAPPSVSEDVEEMIGSLGPVPGALPPGAF
jgi:hypothetical protein